MMPQIEMLESLLESVWDYTLFIFAVLALCAFAMLALLATSAAIAAGWRWLRRHSWRHAVVLLERRALR